MTELNHPNPDWLAFLQQQGAHFDEQNAAEIRYFAAAQTDWTEQANFVAPLTDLGLIAIAGDDAASFLHNQITNDVEKLDLSTARLAGYCTPKGRLLASFLMWKTADAIFLQLPLPLQPAIQKRLQMFVMRSKAKLSDAGNRLVALGLSGPAAATALQTWFPDLPAQPYAKVDNAYGTLIRVADGGNHARYQWITDTANAVAAWPALSSKLTARGASAWRLGEIQAGVPSITAATQEQFVPQMINFELIGGVNFKKGCYPGQEIVARSQYLGKLKRRAVLATIATADVKAGSEVFSSADPEQPCGMVVNAEQNAAGSALCLVEIKLAAIDNGSIHLGSVSGPALQLQRLPYELTDPQ